MAGSGLAEGSGGSGRASRFLDGVVAFVVAIFQPIFHVLASVISPSNQPPRDQHNHQNTSSTQQDQQHKDEDNDSKRHDAVAVAATNTTSHDGDPPLNSRSHSDSDPKKMAPSLHNQPAAGNRFQQPMPLNEETNGQGPAKVSAPRLKSTKVAVKQENVPTNGKASGSHGKDRDLAKATTDAQKLRAVGDEQAQENRQEQLTLPPPICEPETAQDIDDGADEEPEDPATAAERAIHHGFMNQALDMVCYISFHIFPSNCPPLSIHVTFHHLKASSFPHVLTINIPYCPSSQPLLYEVAFHSLAAAFHLCTPHDTTSCRPSFFVVPSPLGSLGRSSERCSC